MCWAFSLINKITLIKSPFYFFNVLAKTWTTEVEDEATTNKSVKLRERKKSIFQVDDSLDDRNIGSIS